MTADERQQIMEALRSSQQRLLDLVRPLTRAQWSFREAPERWSTLEIVEHLLLFERFLLGAVRRTLEQPAEPEKSAASAGKEPLVMGLAGSRHVRIDSREALRPTGGSEDAEALVAALEQARAGTLEFAATTDASLREHFFAHVAFGDLDCVQWLLLIGQHTERHVLQIEQIQADPGYPAA